MWGSFLVGPPAKPIAAQMAAVARHCCHGRADNASPACSTANSVTGNIGMTKKEAANRGGLNSNPAK
jgi:hypothetical protein